MYGMLEYPPSKLECRISHSLLKESYCTPIWMGNLLILFYSNVEEGKTFKILWLSSMNCKNIKNNRYNVHSGE